MIEQILSILPLKRNKISVKMTTKIHNTNLVRDILQRKGVSGIPHSLRLDDVLSDEEINNYYIRRHIQH